MTGVQTCALPICAVVEICGEMGIAEFVLGKGGGTEAAGEVVWGEGAAFLEQGEAAGGEKSDWGVELDFINGSSVCGGDDAQAGGVHGGEGKDVAQGGIGDGGISGGGIKYGPDAGPREGGGGGIGLGGELLPLDISDGDATCRHLQLDDCRLGELSYYGMQ